MLRPQSSQKLLRIFILAAVDSPWESFQCLPTFFMLLYPCSFYRWTLSSHSTSSQFGQCFFERWLASPSTVHRATMLSLFAWMGQASLTHIFCLVSASLLLAMWLTVHWAGKSHLGAVSKLLSFVAFGCKGGQIVWRKGLASFSSCWTELVPV